MPVVSSETVVSAPSENGECNKLYMTAEETTEPEEAKVEGKIPSYISGGKFLRVGPSKFDFPDFTVNHWLDGYAILSKFEIRDETILFAKRYIRTDAYKRAIAQQKPAINEFATRAQSDGKKGFFSRMISALTPEFTDNCYSTLFQIGEDMFATCDTQYFHRIDTSLLDTECKCDTQKFFSLNGQCAHPLTDVNGDIYNIGFSIGATGIKYHLFKIPFGKTSEAMMKSAKIITTLSPRWAGQMGTSHSFGLTSNYVIFIEQPLVVSAKRIAASLVKGDVLKDWMEWKPEEKNRFYVIEKATGKVLKMEVMSAEAFYFLHFINCYEDNNQIVVDLISLNSPKVLDALLLSNLRSKNPVNMTGDLPRVERFILPILPDLKAANIPENVNLITDANTKCTAIRNGSKIIITGDKLTKEGIDLPTFNRRFITRKIRYVYTAGTIDPHEFSNTVCKLDLETREVIKWKMNDNLYPGEPYFVPDPKGTSEDDGLLLVALTDDRHDHADRLVILNAQTMQEIAHAEFKSHLPASVHGIFVNN